MVHRSFRMAGTLSPDSATGLRMGSKGTCSWFGGPEGEGVDEDEGLTFFQSVSDSPHQFRHEQPPNGGSRLLASAQAVTAADATAACAPIV